MNAKILAPVFFVLLLGSTGTFAAEGKVSISSPANGTAVGQHNNVELNYEAVPGPDGDHLHLYLDGKRVDIIHSMKGKADVGMLNPGTHHICLEVNTKGHIPTGAQACVDVTSK